MNKKYYDIIPLTIFPILYFSYIKNTLKISINKDHIETFIILYLIMILSIIIMNLYTKYKINKNLWPKKLDL